MLRARTVIGAVTAAAAALAICGCPPSPEPKPPPHVGGTDAGAPIAPGPRWRQREFVRATEGCTQTWTCDCSAAPGRAGCHAEGSSDTTTSGACAADTGPVNGCTRCLAIEPATACACSIVCP